MMEPPRRNYRCNCRPNSRGSSTRMFATPLCLDARTDPKITRSHPRRACAQLPETVKIIAAITLPLSLFIHPSVLFASYANLKLLPLSSKKLDSLLLPVERQISQTFRLNAGALDYSRRTKSARMAKILKKRRVQCAEMKVKLEHTIVAIKSDR